VACGEQAQAEAIADDRHVKRHGFQPVFGDPEAAAEQGCGDFRTQGRLVAREMVGVGVRDKGTRFRVPWVQPQVGLRQVEAALVTNFDQTAGGLRIFPGIAKANRPDATHQGIQPQRRKNFTVA
jgi:hypothetical protein